MTLVVAIVALKLLTTPPLRLYPTRVEIQNPVRLIEAPTDLPTAPFKLRVVTVATCDYLENAFNGTTCFLSVGTE